jgi:RimJ/RimL family protein N-acetyltransferase
LRTTRLELRLPTEDEVVELAHLAEQGVHPPEFMPFFVAWTDAIGSPGYVDGFAAYHRAARASWRPDEWRLNFGVWTDEGLIGTQGVEANEFAATRVAQTGSWLGQRFQGRGYGTEMRAAVLELAFAGLGAELSMSGALEGNVASTRVSEKLGYEPAGEATASPRGEPVREQRFRLTREVWESRARIDVEIVGLELCLPLFGL